MLDGIEGWRIPSRHHRGPLLLPLSGDPELDRFWVAQLARETLVEDARSRNRALQGQRRAAATRRKALRR